MKGELEYRAVVAVGVDLETGEVELVTVRAATDEDERVDLSVSLDSDEEQPDEVYERAQQIVDAGAPFELSGWWAPSPDQRWAPVVEEDDERDDEIKERPVRCRSRRRRTSGRSRPTRSPTKDELSESHREGLRKAAIVYLDECYNALAQLDPGDSYADYPIGCYLARRYEHYYDARFARDWVATVTIVGWKLAQPSELKLSCVAEELAALGADQAGRGATRDRRRRKQPGCLERLPRVRLRGRGLPLALQPRARRDRGVRVGPRARRRQPTVQRVVQAIQGRSFRRAESF